MEPLIEKQFKKWGLSQQRLPTDLKEWSKFLGLVETMFEEKERNEYLLERALGVVTGELNLLQEDLGRNRASKIPLEPEAYHQQIADIESAKREIDELNRHLQMQTSLANHLANEAEAASRAKTMFLSNMSHEIRSPMNTVLGMASLLHGTKLDDEQKEFVECIQRSGGNLLNLINDIIDYSKIESGSIHLDYSEFEPLMALQDTFAMFSSQAETKGLRFEYGIDPQVPDKLKGDVLRIQQVWINLISNALKFTESGCVQVDLSVEPAGRSFIRLKTRVKDSGIGMEKEMVEELFGAFVQEDGSETRKFGGNGLGLAISKRLCQLMGGDLTLCKSDKTGSEFSFSCLVSSVSKAAPVYASTFDPGARQVRLVFVDPSRFSRRTFNQILNYWKIEHESFSDLNTMVLSKAYDRAELIVIHMDALRGMHCQIPDLLGNLRTDTNHFVIMGHTPAEREIFEGLEQVHFLQEPLDPRQLNYLIREIGNRSCGGESVARAPDVKWEENRSNLMQFSERFPMKILLVEDSVMNQKVTRFIMRKLGYQIEVVSNGEEAVQWLANRDYDLVLMDLQMPVMGGTAACRAIREQKNTSACPYICALTANVSVEDQLLCRKVKMDDFLAKPLSLEALKQVMKKAYAHLQARRCANEPVADAR